MAKDTQPFFRFILIIITLIFLFVFGVNYWTLEPKKYDTIDIMVYVPKGNEINITMSYNNMRYDVVSITSLDHIPEYRTDFNIVGIEPFSVATMDFNSDGLEDIITANYVSNTIGILYNAMGTFIPERSMSISVGNGPYMVRTGNLNGNSIDDIVVSNKLSAKITVIFDKLRYLNVSTGSYPTDISVADFNGNGINDVAVICMVSRDLEILSFSYSGEVTWHQRISLNGVPVALITGDFDYDLRMEIAVCIRHGNNGSVQFFDFRSGNMILYQSIFLNNSYPVCMASYNYNGLWYFAIGTNAHDIVVYNQDLKPCFQIPSKGQYRRLYCGDFDNDGIDELGLLKEIPFELEILNIEGKVLSHERTIPLGSYPRDLVLADMDSDGLNDIIVANENDNSVSVIYGCRYLALNTGVSIADEPRGVYFSDVDGDSIEEVLVASVSNGTVTVLKGQNGIYDVVKVMDVGGYCRDIVGYTHGNRTYIAAAIERERTLVFLGYREENGLYIENRMILNVMPYRLYVVKYHNHTYIYAVDKNAKGFDIIDPWSMEVHGIKANGTVAIGYSNDKIYTLTNNGTIYRYIPKNNTLVFVFKLMSPMGSKVDYRDMCVFQYDEDIVFFITVPTDDRILGVVMHKDEVTLKRYDLCPGTMPDRIKITDLYNDYNIDLVVSCVGNRSDLLLINYDTDDMIQLYCGRGVRDIAIGDGNGDGFADIAAVSEGSDRVFIWDSFHRPTTAYTYLDQDKLVVGSYSGGYYKIDLKEKVEYVWPQSLGIMTLAAVVIVLLRVSEK